MWKKLLVASIASVGILAGFCGSNVSADSALLWDYTPGSNMDIFSGDVSVCINKLGGYTGDTITANIKNSSYSAQINFGTFSGNEACKMVNGIPSNSKIQFVIPMRAGDNFKYFAAEDGNGKVATLRIGNDSNIDAYLTSYGSYENVTGASAFEVSFNANGGTGTMAAVTAAVADGSVTLPASTLARTDYVFDGWNTKADGTGTDYADGATINFTEGGELELFAKWKENFATLMTGVEFNKALKIMTNGEQLAPGTSDATIKTIEFVDELPSNFEYIARTNVEASESIPIFAYYDGDGHIYIDSEASRIYANPSSKNMFSTMRNLETITFPDSRAFSTSRVTDMGFMFGDNWIPGIDPGNSLTTINGIEYFDTSNVTNMSHMFGRQKLSSTDGMATTQRDGYKSWDVSNVKNMSAMFSDNEYLANISALETWNIESLEDISSLFSGCKLLDDITVLTGWDVSDIVKMDGMFFGDSSLSDIGPLASWNTSKITSLNGLFYGTSISSLEPLRTSQRSGYKSWDVSGIRSMVATFSYNDSLVDIAALSSWDVSNVEKFGNCNSYSGSGYGGGAGIFEGDRNLTDISALSGWDVSNVVNMCKMFGMTNNQGRMSLSDISPLEKWNISSVTSMFGMFTDTAITNIEPLRTTQRDGYKSWDMSNVEDIAGLFSGVTSLSDISALSSWDVSNIKEIGSLFSGNTSLTNLTPLSGWNVSSVIRMNGVFSGNTSLSDLSPIAGWNVENVNQFNSAFRGDSLIRDLSPLRNWPVKNTASLNYIFDGIPSSVARPDWYHE